MSVKAEILDGEGSGTQAGVTPANALKVVQIPVTARGIPSEVVANQRQLVSPFLNEAGSDSQIVDGSVTPVEFSIEAVQGFTRWITGYRMVIYGARLDLSVPGEIRRYSDAGAGLTNGIEIEIQQAGGLSSVTTDPIKTIADYLLYASEFTNLVGGISTNEDFLRIDFVFPVPVVLTEGSVDKIVVRIRDDMTSALGSANAKQCTLGIGWEEKL